MMDLDGSQRRSMSLARGAAPLHPTYPLLSLSLCLRGKVLLRASAFRATSASVDFASGGAQGFVNLSAPVACAWFLWQLAASPLPCMQRRLAAARWGHKLDGAWGMCWSK